jgi:hypothetical protein
MHQVIGVTKKVAKKSICAPIRRRNTPARIIQGWAWAVCFCGIMPSDLITVAAMVAIARVTIRGDCRIAQMWGQILQKVGCRGVVLGVVRLGLLLRKLSAKNAINAQNTEGCLLSNLDARFVQRMVSSR